SDLSALERQQLEDLRSVLATTLEAAEQTRDAYRAAAAELQEDMQERLRAVTEQLSGLIRDDLGDSIGSFQEATRSLSEATAKLKEVTEWLEAVGQDATSARALFQPRHAGA